MITAAIGLHGLWRARLKSAINTSRSDFNVAVVRVDDECEFGEFLRTKIDARVMASSDYQSCLKLHREFHALTASVLELALSGRKAEALRALEIGSPFSRTSGSLTAAMLQWRDNLSH